jgi:hypothetical protein
MVTHAIVQFLYENEFVRALKKQFEFFLRGPIIVCSSTVPELHICEVKPISLDLRISGTVELHMY